MTGAIIEATGAHAAPAGTALKIVGSVIQYWQHIVFTNIEWGQANGAKKLLKEAQAGNPIARMQIFEDSNRYAKMYIAILVKDGNPLAKKFIEQRGIEEGDLDQSMSLKILREAMLKDVDQRDETDVADLGLAGGHRSRGIVGSGPIKVGKAHVLTMRSPRSRTKSARTAKSGLRRSLDLHGHHLDSRRCF